MAVCALMSRVGQHKVCAHTCIRYDVELHITDNVQWVCAIIGSFLYAVVNAPQ
jgi:hypothetical protein